MLTDLLFQTPLWLMALLGVIAVTLLLSANRRRSKQLMYGGVGALALGLVLALLSVFVDTPKKKVARRTRELVAAVVAADDDRIRPLIHPQVDAMGMGKEQIVHAAVQSARDSEVESVSISGLTVTQDSSGIIASRFNCVAKFKPESPIQVTDVPSSWELQWLDAPGQDWCCTNIRCIGAFGQSGSVIEDYIRARSFVQRITGN